MMHERGKAKKDRKLGAEAYTFAALFFVSFSILLFSTQSFIVNVRDTGLSVFSGVRGGVHSISSFVTRTVNSIGELSALRERYEELSAKLSRYEELERSAAEIRQENYRLREQLGFSEVLSFKHISAEIVGRDPDNLYKALVINKGSSHGIKKDMPVIAYQNGVGALAGKVVQTAPFESLVLPLYDERCYAAARFAQSRYEGISSGKGSAGEPLVMQSIDKRARDTINKGDVVISSGLGGVYPAGIGIGRVRTEPVENTDSSFEVEIEPFIDFARLEYVFILEIDSEPDANGARISEQFDLEYPQE